eukprot:7062845-Prymnesium_polylepis.1
MGGWGGHVARTFLRMMRLGSTERSAPLATGTSSRVGRSAAASDERGRKTRRGAGPWRAGA